jgi:hypothetical protein
LREVATTLTDYLLTVLCTVCVWRLVATGAAARLRGGAISLPGFAAASFFGGTWHGFLIVAQGLGQHLVWWLSTLFAGVTAAGLALTGLGLLGVKRERLALVVMCALLVIYAAITWRDTRFIVPLIASLGGTVLCVAGLVRYLRLPDNRGAWLILAALGLSLLAAVARGEASLHRRIRPRHLSLR